MFRFSLLFASIVISFSALAQFDYPAIPVTVLPESPAICNLGYVIVECPQTGYSQYLWKDANDNVLQDFDGNPFTAQISAAGDYSLTVIHNGCTTTVDFYVGDLRDPLLIQEYMEQNNFLAIPITFDVVGINGKGGNGNTKSVNTCNVPDVIVKDDVVNVKYVIESLTSSFKVLRDYAEGLSVNMTENNCLCTEGTEVLWSELYVEDVNIWGHVWENPANVEEGVLYLKANSTYQGELPLVDQKTFLEDENFDLVKDYASGSAETLRIMVQNLLMAFPTIGFGVDPTYCNIDPAVATNSYFLTPAGVPCEIQSASSSLAFASINEVSSILGNSVVAFRKGLDTYLWHTIHPSANGLAAGYYSFGTGDFIEDLSELEGTAQIDIVNSLRSCVSDCLVNVMKSVQVTKLTVEDLAAGGFMETVVESLKELINEYSSYEFFLTDYMDVAENVICAIRNNDESVDYPSFLDGGIIWLPNLNYQGETYNSFAISFPENGNGTLELLEAGPIRDVSLGYADIEGFYGSIRIGDEEDARIQIFEDHLDNPPVLVDRGVLWDQFYPDHLSCYANPTSTATLHDDLKVDATEDENLLIFVNGYRFSAFADHAREPGYSNCFDNYNKTGPYWEAMATSFIDRVKTKNVVYIDGHNKITTSNHNVNGSTSLSKGQFLSNLISAYCRHPDNRYSIRQIHFGGLFGPRNHCNRKCKGVPDEAFNCKPHDYLMTTPNDAGFALRFEAGRQDGKALGAELTDSQGKTKIKLDANGKIAGKIDIVAHSMGYAHAIGVLSGLMEGENGESFMADDNTFGHFYIIAPENACSGADVNLGNVASNLSLDRFENVWQYGTEEWQTDGEAPFHYADFDASYRPVNLLDGHQPWQQDGIAPQCAVPNLSFIQAINTSSADYQARRIRFAGDNDHLNFKDAHSASSYGWIFSIGSGVDGHVNKRD